MGGNRAPLRFLRRLPLLWVRQFPFFDLLYQKEMLKPGPHSLIVRMVLHPLSQGFLRHEDTGQSTCGQHPPVESVSSGIFRSTHCKFSFSVAFDLAKTRTNSLFSFPFRAHISASTTPIRSLIGVRNKRR